MKILKVRVDWMYEWGNDPMLYLLVDKWPKDFVYQKKGSLYWAEKEGAVSFLASSSDHRGFGGQKFELLLENGTTETLVGPWSSSPPSMAGAGFPWSVDISFTNDPDVWEQGHTFFAGHISVPLAEEACRMAGVTLEGPRGHFTHTKNTQEASTEQLAVIVGETPHYRVAGKQERFTKAKITEHGSLSYTVRLVGQSKLYPECYLMETKDFMDRVWIRPAEAGLWTRVKLKPSELFEAIEKPFQLEFVGGYWPVVQKS